MPSSSSSSKTATTLDSDEYYYDDEEYDQSTAVSRKISTTTAKTTAATTTKPPKGYDSFIKSIPKQVTRLQPVYNDHDSLGEDNDSNDAADDDDYYYDDDYSFHIPPPNKYMPMSETRPPKPTPSYRNSSLHPTKYPFDSSTRKSPLQYNDRPDTQTSIPAIISFPKDIFQDIKPFNHLPRYLNHSTLRPYTLRTRLVATNVPDSGTDLLKITSSPTTTSTTTTETTTTTARPLTTSKPRSSTTTRKIYTIRPSRGQSRWKIAKSVKGSDKQNLLELDEKLPNR